MIADRGGSTSALAMSGLRCISVAIRISGFTDWSISATVSFLAILSWQLTTITRSFLVLLFRPDGGRRGDDVASGVM